MNETYIKNVVEAALLAAGRPLQLPELAQLFDASAMPEPATLRAALEGLEADYSGRGIEVKETATGFRIQVRRELANEVSRLWPERPPRFSRALLETLALIAYRQPITRAEIEAVRGVAVNPNIIKTILERNWVRVVGTRDVPGRPELLGTTKEFLDYFGLRSLEDLPPLAELKAMGEINLQLDLAKPNEPSDPDGGPEGSNGAGGAEGGEPGGAGTASGERAAGVAGSAEGADIASEEGVRTFEGADEASQDDVQAFQAADQALEEEVQAFEGVDQVSEHASEAVESAEPASAPVAAASFFGVEAVSHAEIESDSGDVTVEVETLRLVEARIEASIESDIAAPVADAAIETGEFEMAELGVNVAAERARLIEAEFDVSDLEPAGLDDDTADDEEDSSDGPHASSELVAASRDRDD